VVASLVLWLLVGCITEFVVIALTNIERNFYWAKEKKEPRAVFYEPQVRQA
jgi:hypothetical protein